MIVRRGVAADLWSISPSHDRYFAANQDLARKSAVLSCFIMFGQAHIIGCEQKKVNVNPVLKE